MYLKQPMFPTLAHQRHPCLSRPKGTGYKVIGLRVFNSGRGADFKPFHCQAHGRLLIRGGLAAVGRCQAGREMTACHQSATQPFSPPPPLSSWPLPWCSNIQRNKTKDISVTQRGMRMSCSIKMCDILQQKWRPVSKLNLHNRKSAFFFFFVHTQTHVCSTLCKFEILNIPSPAHRE